MNMCVIPVMTGVCVALCDGSIIVRVCVCVCVCGGGGGLGLAPPGVCGCVWVCVGVHVFLHVRMHAYVYVHGLRACINVCGCIPYGGLLHCLLRERTPPPQVREHDPNLFQ